MNARWTGQLRCRRPPAVLASTFALVLICGGCVSHRHVLRAFQNGNELGRWTVKTAAETNYEALMENGRHLVILPARGVFIGTLWYRSGGVVIESEEVSP